MVFSCAIDTQNNNQTCPGEKMMKNKIILSLCLSMPLWLVACGGGSSSETTSSEPATGISSGTITGFGSVFVNGVKFNTDNASVSRGDDSVNDVRELEIGMVVRVQGDIQNRIASSVSFEEDVKGPADGPATGASFSVMGQTIITDPATVFNNTSLTAIVEGDILEISGLRNADDDIVASFVEKKTKPANVKSYSLIGNVRNLDTSARTFNIDDLSIDYNGANVNDLASGHPVEGQLVEVKDEFKIYLPASLNLSATKVEPQNRLGNGAIAGAEVEIESIVTEVISASEFIIGDIQVQISSSTRFLFGTASNIIPGVRLEVEGVLDDSGILQAGKIKFEDNDARIQARVDDTGGVNATDGTVTLLGITVSITSTTDMEDKRDNVSPFSLADIHGDDYLEIRGFIGANDTFVASELRRKSDDSTVEIRGPVSTKEPDTGTVTILGVTVSTNGSTEFKGLNDERLTASQFFDAIVEGLTVVHAKWDPFSDTSQIVKELELED